MNQQTDVNTEILNSQANNAKDALLSSDTIRQQLTDIESQALAAQTLCEISFEEIDSVTSSDPSVAYAILRLDALIKAACRNVVLIQRSVIEIGANLLQSKGGAV